MSSPKQALNDVLGRHNLIVRRTLPRPSTLFAQNLMGNRPVNVVEIGTFEGKNAASILRMLNVKKMYCIDPYMAYEDYKSDGSYERVKRLQRRSHRIIGRLSSKSNAKVEWIEEFSDKAAAKIEREQIDFVYVDGNHTYPYVKKDLELYFDKIRPGGVIAGHDIEFEEVCRAVMEFAVERKLKVHIKSPDWIIVKPKAG